MNLVELARGALHDGGHRPVLSTAEVASRIGASELDAHVALWSLVKCGEVVTTRQLTRRYWRARSE